MQQALFGLGGGPADKLSLNMLILFGAVAYFASFLAVHLLPAREAMPGGDGRSGPRGRNAGSRCRPGGGGRRTGARSRSARRVAAGLALRLKIDPVASVLTTFLAVCLIRKSFLDALLRRRGAESLSR